MDYKPLIESISRLIGTTGKVAEGAAKKGQASVRTSVDVEKWLGPLSAPEKQLPLIHDYLRGHAALTEAEMSGATHVRDISVPVWKSSQKFLQERVDTDAEVQGALKNLFIGRETPKDPGMTTTAVPAPKKVAVSQSVEVDAATQNIPQATPTKIKPELDVLAKKQRATAWNEFAVATEAQDAHRIDTALERLRVLHDRDQPTTPGEKAEWQKALDYMAGLEQQVQQWRAAGVPNESWSTSLARYKEESGIDAMPLPRYVRDTVDRFEAWADAQKPPTMEDRFAEALGVPRALMSSGDFSAPGRQGLLMLSRPEYWQNLRPMFEARNTAKFQESQAYIRNHPDFQVAQEAGLALADIHSRLLPREEAFQSKLAERIPGIGGVVKASEQSYVTFLNRLRLDVFSNAMREAAAAGHDVASRDFQKSLAEWINTSTGRGGRNFNPGPLSTVLFSPRLAISRFQTFNPMYYYKMHPYVRQQALKTNLSAAAFVFGLVSLAGLGGAKVTWDFRNSDAGKIRIGNTRLDVGGGHLQFLRLFTQLATNQRMNAETGKVTQLGEKFGQDTRLDVFLNFIMSKEAPVPSLVTDMMRGHDLTGKKFDPTDAVVSRVVPLAVQDMYDVLKDQGVQALFYAAPALMGVGVQTYEPRAPKANVPFIDVRGQVPPEHAAEYIKAIEAADSIATAKAVARSKGLGPAATKAILENFIKAERMKARLEWIRTNRDAFVRARMAGQDTTSLAAPEGQ